MSKGKWKRKAVVPEIGITIAVWDDYDSKKPRLIFSDMLSTLAVRERRRLNRSLLFAIKNYFNCSGNKAADILGFSRSAASVRMRS